MSNAMTIDKDLTLKIESQIDDLRRYKDSVHLGALLVAVEQMLGSQHLLVLKHFPFVSHHFHRNSSQLQTMRPFTLEFRFGVVNLSYLN